jgi:FkbM family methyltransferase
MFDILKKYDFNSVIDIGAHHGIFYKELSKVKQINKWLLIEANKNCSLHLENLNVPYRIAMLSDSIKTLPYYQHKYDSTCTGNSYYRELSHHYTDDNILIDNIQTSTLDLITDNEQFDLIKIDTQGAELDILRGGLVTLSKAKYVLLETSLLPYNLNAPLQPVVIDFMTENGFSEYEVIDCLRLSGIHQEDLLFKK